MLNADFLGGLRREWWVRAGYTVLMIGTVGEKEWEEGLFGLAVLQDLVKIIGGAIEDGEVMIDTFDG